MKIAFNKPILLVPISDLTIVETIIKRKAQLNFLLYQPVNKFLTISVQIISFAANADGSYGEQFDENLVRSYERTFTAKIGENLVDVTTGLTLCDSSAEFISDDQGKTVLNPVLEGKNYAEEFDFYDNVANTSPVIINDLIKNFILYTDATGRFNKA
jgi:hypothetical protein